MWTKLQNSWQLVKASARVLQADKELMIFPLLSGLAVIVVTASFIVPLFFVGEGLGDSAGVLEYVGVFAFYVVQYSVIFCFNSALVGAAMIRLDGGDPTVRDGLRIAWSHLGSIFGYAVIAATVGLLLRAASEKSGALGKIVIGVIGMAWNLATFLVVPILVTRKVGPIDALNESAAILKKTWGEQIAGNAAIGLTFFFLFLGLTILAVPVLFLVLPAGQPVLIAATVVAFGLAYILLALLNASLSGIYSAALYRFATTGDAGQFDSNLLENAFVAKS